ncbi:MAG: gp58-like family protein, partial [Lentisphaeraceae bacterium]|nr:gp58-like family protein [Lentisphaeraceae bacterium]
MNTSSEPFQLGKFKFRSTSSNVEIFFQDEVKEEEEVSAFNTEQLEAEYKRGVDETTKVLQAKIDQLQKQVTEQQQGFQTQIDSLASGFQEHLKEMDKQVLDEVCSMRFTLAELILQNEVLDKEGLE